jgi:hypothetical protein
MGTRKPIASYRQRVVRTEAESQTQTTQDVQFWSKIHSFEIKITENFPEIKSDN